MATPLSSLPNNACEPTSGDGRGSWELISGLINRTLRHRRVGRQWAQYTPTRAPDVATDGALPTRPEPA